MASEWTSTGVTAAVVEPAGEAPDLDLRAVDLGRGLKTLAILEYLKSSWGEQEREFQFKVSSQDG